MIVRYGVHENEHADTVLCGCMHPYKRREWEQAVIECAIIECFKKERMVVSTHYIIVTSLSFISTTDNAIWRE
jgi:hypothetical protein